MLCHWCLSPSSPQVPSYCVFSPMRKGKAQRNVPAIQQQINTNVIIITNINNAMDININNGSCWPRAESIMATEVQSDRRLIRANNGKKNMKKIWLISLPIFGIDYDWLWRSWSFFAWKNPRRLLGLDSKLLLHRWENLATKRNSQSHCHCQHWHLSKECFFYWWQVGVPHPLDSSQNGVEQNINLTKPTF